jgi:hypothetical protein
MHPVVFFVYHWEGDAANANDPFAFGNNGQD